MRQPFGTRTQRDLSSDGLSKRARFEASLGLLCELGLSRDALAYCRRIARKTRQLPHAVVCELVERAAEIARVKTIVNKSDV